MKQPLIVITGPTAVGKSALSVELAHRINGEIISADSMQVYRHMNIGTAKITPKEMEGVPHYLIDVLEPSQDFSVYTFKAMADNAIQTIYAHGNIPIIAGGTGFYIQSVLYDIDFTQTEADTAYRDSLFMLAADKGCEYVHKLLREADPVSAAQIHANNVKRVVRALEYYHQTGQPISLHNEEQKLHESPYNFVYFVLNDDRADIYERIDRRVDKMLSQGLVDEVRSLMEQGYDRSYVSMKGIGYKEIIDYLEGITTLEEAVYIIKRDTRHFAKRQLTWFRREKDVTFVNINDFNSRSAIADYMIKILQEKSIIQ